MKWPSLPMAPSSQGHTVTRGTQVKSFFTAPARRRLALSVVAAAAVAVPLLPQSGALADTSPPISIVHYDASSLAQYKSMWSNPYGLGEMAVHDTRSVANGVFSLSAVPFQTSADYSVFDHLKYLAVSNESFPVPDNGSLTFSADIKASTPGAVAGHQIVGQYGPPGSFDPMKPITYTRNLLEGQQAAVVLNMISFCTGQLFDWFVSGNYAFPLYERLPSTVSGNLTNPNCPNAENVGLDKAFTQIVRQVPIKPGVTHNVAIVYTRLGSSNNVTYLLDGIPVASINNVGVPLDKQGQSYSGIYPSLGPGENLTEQLNSFQIGHGLFSLLDAFPFQYGCTPPTSTGPGVCDSSTAQYSVSIPTSQRDFGQGAVGSFSHFTVITVGH
jgi:hypothetical protein